MCLVSCLACLPLSIHAWTLLSVSCHCALCLWRGPGCLYGELTCIAKRCEVDMYKLEALWTDMQSLWEQTPTTPRQSRTQSDMVRG